MVRWEWWVVREERWLFRWEWLVVRMEWWVVRWEWWGGERGEVGD